MHLTQETSAYNTNLAGEDATSVATPSDAFEQALRDAFDAHRVTNDAIHAGDSPSAGAGAPATALSAFNDLLEVEILALRVTQERDAFDSYVSKHGYGTSLSGVDIEDAVGDIDSFNTANEALYKSTYISEQDAKLQTFLAGQGLQSVVSVNVDTSNFQNATDIKRAVGDQASADWKAKRADDQTTYLTNNDLANEGLGGIDDAMSNIVTWNAQAVTAARTKYLADSGLAAQGVTVGQFGDGSGFNYTATPTNGATQYGGDPPAFAVTPVFVAPGVFSFSPAYAWTTYALTKTHAHSAYALSEPGSFNVTTFTWPTHIHKRNVISLSVYHKHWYMQLDDRCQATCSGSQHATTDRDTDALAGDRVACDPDDLVCPAGNAQPAYEEFQGIIKSLHDENTVHPECPVDDPCLLTPPPCFYVSTECVPTNVVDLQLDSSAQRTQERGTPAISADDLYLHEPLVMDDVVEWKLVSSAVAHDSPKLWDYNDGIVMEAYVSPVDSRPYHKMYLRVDAAGVEQLRRARGVRILNRGNRAYEPGRAHAVWSELVHGAQPRVRRRAHRSERNVAEEFWGNRVPAALQPVQRHLRRVLAKPRVHTGADVSVALVRVRHVHGNMRRHDLSRRTVGANNRNISRVPRRARAFRKKLRVPRRRLARGRAFRKRRRVRAGRRRSVRARRRRRARRERIGQESQGLRGSENGQRGGKKDAECHVRCAEWVRNTTIITEYCYVHGSANESFLQ